MHYSSVILLAATAGTALAEEGCSPLHFIWARATTEPPQARSGSSFVDNPAAFEAAASSIWSKGFGAAGASIASNVTKLIPAATTWPVHYPAAGGRCASEDPGVADVLNQIHTKAKACPNQKYVLGGHSQGGVVIMRAIPHIDKEILPRVIAVTGVGSPPCAAEVADRCRVYCNTGDSICTTKWTGSSGCTPGPVGGASGSPAVAAPKMPKAAGIPKAAPKPAPKGGMGDMAGMDMRKEKRAVDSVQQAWSSDEAMREWMQKITADESMCAGAEVTDFVGHKAKGSKPAHFAYSEDGFYVYAAACFVLKQFKASGGA